MQTPATIAKLVSGPRRLVGPAMVLILIAFSVVLVIPLLRVQAYFVTNEIILVRVAHDLFFIDSVLFIIVFVFGMVLPAGKMIASICCWYVLPLQSWSKFSNTLVLLGRLSVLDILLIALVIVALKGVGVGTVQIEPGLYVYCAVVVGSNILSITMNSIAKTLYSTSLGSPASTLMIAAQDFQDASVAGRLNQLSNEKLDVHVRSTRHGIPDSGIGL